jgi:Ca2+-binding RTX toxin-like protein
VDHLRNGGGLNGEYRLSSAAGQATGFGDGTADVLTGGDGFDWFFGEPNEDMIAALAEEILN